MLSVNYLSDLPNLKMGKDCMVGYTKFQKLKFFLRFGAFSFFEREKGNFCFKHSEQLNCFRIFVFPTDPSKAIKCKVGDFAQKVVGTQSSFSLSTGCFALPILQHQ